jgi:alcohol dehydrogenase class IV
MEAFIYEALPARVVFGRGTLAKLGEEVDRLGLTRIIVLATPQQEDQAAEMSERLGNRSAGTFSGAVMHTPVDVTETALNYVREHRADGLLAIGGGSTTGLSKAISLRTGLPQVVIPTTYAGSEMTPILGETKAGIKTTQRTMAVLPKVVLYDVDLTLSLPPGLSATSGMNAIAHAVEALYARDANPIVSLMAQDGIASLARALPGIVTNPTDPEARSDALYGAFLCGVCLGAVGMALHHKLCHVLGGTFDLPHAETHTIVLPHAVAYNAAAAPSAMGRIAASLGSADAAQGLYDLAGRLGTARALSKIGMPKDSIRQAADLAVLNPYWNPRPLERSAIEELIARAWAGEKPLP